MFFCPWIFCLSRLQDFPMILHTMHTKWYIPFIYLFFKSNILFFRNQDNSKPNVMKPQNPSKLAIYKMLSIIIPLPYLLIQTTKPFWLKCIVAEPRFWLRYYFAINISTKDWARPKKKQCFLLICIFWK